MLQQLAQNALGDYTSAFNENLTKLINALLSKNRDNVDLLQMKDQLNVARKEMPRNIVELVGPHVWKYREQISNRDFNNLLNNVYENDVIEAAGDEIVDNDKLAKASRIIQICKLTWHMFTAPEKEVIIKYITALLSGYAGYLSAIKHVQVNNNK